MAQSDSSKLPGNALITIYKSFIKPQLDYGDTVYDQPTNGSFSKKLENIQCNAALAITGAIKGTSQEKVYKDLGLESLKLMRKLRHLSMNILQNKTTCLLTYIFRLISCTTHSYQTRILDYVTAYYQCRVK